MLSFKHSLLSVLTTVVCACFINTVAFAEHTQFTGTYTPVYENDMYTGLLVDLDNTLSDTQETELKTIANQVADHIECNVGVLITDDLMGMSPKEYGERKLYDYFRNDEDSILLVLCNDFDAEDGYDWIGATGYAADKYGKHTSDIFNAIYAQLTSKGYYGGILGFYNYLDPMVSLNVPENTSYLVILDDQDAVLSASEKSDLESKMRQVAESIECNVGCVITDNLLGMNEAEYCLNYSQEHFSFGSDLVLLLFCNDHINYDYIYTYGKGSDLYAHKVDSIFDSVYYGLDTSGYYKAIVNFCGKLQSSYSSQIADDYDAYHTEDDYYIDGDDVSVFGLFLNALPVCMVVAILICVIGTVGYRKTSPISASVYIKPSDVWYKDRDLRFLYEHTTSYTSSSSSGGRSHRSGSRSRSGGGGRSRSGGGGGRGRRR